jgi:phosphate transport system permease protein
MNPNHDHYPEGESFRRSLSGRYRTASIWQALFFSALVIAILSLAALLYNIMDGSFGYVAFEYKNDPTKFTAKPLDDLNQQNCWIFSKPIFHPAHSQSWIMQSQW